MFSRRTRQAQAVQFFFSGQYFQRIKQNHRRALDQYRNAQTLCADHPFAPRWQFNMAMCNVALGNREAINALFRLAAEQGHASAQSYLGVMYAIGRGVLKDSVLAHMWLNIAGANGDEGARENRDTLERVMTRAEISRATELARECMDSDYQDCAP